MNKEKIAKELMVIARELTARTWTLPEDSGDVSEIIEMVKRMKGGDAPRFDSSDPIESFGSLLGDDGLGDDFNKEEIRYYKACADAVRSCVKRMVKQGRDSFKDPNQYDMIVKLSKKI